MKRTELKRKTPLSSVPTKKRSPTKRRLVPIEGPHCASRGCKTTTLRVIVSADERYCAKHGTKKADDACRAWFRANYQRCVACGRSDRGIQWAHIHSRGMRFIRWDRDNAVGLCQPCHFAYTQSPSRWVKFVERKWPGLFTRTLHRELFADAVGGSIDVGAVIASYRAGIPVFCPDPPPGWLAESASRSAEVPADPAGEE